MGMDPLIDALESRVSGLSQCELGFYNDSWSIRQDFEETKTIFFGRNFTRTPKVVTSVAMFNGNQWSHSGFTRGVVSVPKRPTTAKFDLYTFVSGVNFGWGVSWMACA